MVNLQDMVIANTTTTTTTTTIKRHFAKLKLIYWTK